MSLQAPLWLWLIPLLLALLWWLHRRASANAVITVSAVNLWPTAADPASGLRRRLPDRRWLLRALLLSLLALCLSAPSWRTGKVAATVDEGIEISALTLKRDYRSGGYSAMFSVINRGNESGTVDLELRVDGVVLHRESVSVAGAATWEKQLQLQHAPLAAVQLEAVHSATTRAQLTAAELLPLPVQLAASCGPDLRRALQTHPGLRSAASGDPGAVMAIACAGAPAVEALPTLLLPARTILQPLQATPWWAYETQQPIHLEGSWLQYAAGIQFTSSDKPLLLAADRTLLARRATHLVSAFDLEASALVTQPAYPLLVTELLDQLTAVDLHHGTVSARPNPAPDSPGPAPERPLTPYLLLLCLLLVGAEMLLYRKP
jgi:hypothetical protein